MKYIKLSLNREWIHANGIDDCDCHYLNFKLSGDPAYHGYIKRPP